MTQIQDLWHSTDAAAWHEALDRYWSFVRPENLRLERLLDQLDPKRLLGMSASEWFHFLRDEYFPWKYTARNRLATTTKSLTSYLNDDGLSELDRIRRNLLQADTEDILLSLKIASAIRGLGTAGATGLLALIHPRHFGTVDQFVVKALCGLTGMPESAAIARINPVSLTERDAVQLIRILRGKAAELNGQFATSFWTPRKVDMVLWACRPA